MTYNVFGGTLNPTTLNPTTLVKSHSICNLLSPLVGLPIIQRDGQTDTSHHFVMPPRHEGQGIIRPREHSIVIKVVMLITHCSRDTTLQILLKEVVKQSSFKSSNFKSVTVFAAT